MGPTSCVSGAGDGVGDDWMTEGVEIVEDERRDVDDVADEERGDGIATWLHRGQRGAAVALV